MTTTIAIEIDTDRLSSHNDQYLAALWHVAQANPVPIEVESAGEVAEAIGREIIRRWLASVPAELWHHTGSHHYWSVLREHGKWLPANGDDSVRRWTPNATT